MRVPRDATASADRSRRGRVSSPASGPVASRALSTRVLRSAPAVLYVYRNRLFFIHTEAFTQNAAENNLSERRHTRPCGKNAQRNRSCDCAGKLMVTSCAFRRGSPSGLGATRAPRRVVGSTHHTSQAEGTSVSPRHHSARLASTICRAAARLADVARAASVGESRLAAE